MPFTRTNKNMKKPSKSHKQNILQKKKSVKNMKVMRGGFTPDEIKTFFEELTSKEEKGRFLLGKGKDSTELNRNFFESDPNGTRGSIKLKAEWHNMVNNEVNDRGQTPLYVLLRFGKSSQLIDILLNVPNIDVNRQNKDGSTALIGYCFGNNDGTRINWYRLSDLLMKFGKKGAVFSMENKMGETPFGWIDWKSRNGLIDWPN